MQTPDSRGHTATMRDLESEAASAARFDVRVLLTGESGVGKQTLARLIHARSRGASAPFVTVDCSEVSDSMFESEWLDPLMASPWPDHSAPNGWLRTAEGGTILIRGLEKLTSRKQATLFRYLDARQANATASGSGSLDVRLLASAEGTLLKAVEWGAFRQDLFYRLNTVHLSVPALRDRSEDIPVLFDYFIQEIAEARRCMRPRVTPEILGRLMSYSWPENVRELKLVAKRFVMSGGDIHAASPSLSRQLHLESAREKRPFLSRPANIASIDTPRPFFAVRPRSD